MADKGKQVSAGNVNDEVCNSNSMDQPADSTNSSAIVTSFCPSEQSSIDSGVLIETSNDEIDDDVLTQPNDVERSSFQWLHALDYQITGACRADERIKPMLKLNASSGAAEERLLLHLNQHFEASEIGMLARCICVPLVCIRVGKVTKHGNILRPTSVRGNLKLLLLPTSDLKILFSGDDGSVEILYSILRNDHYSTVRIECIPADSSGRSFVVKTIGNDFYFWCCEKSKLLGDELLSKMKDLLQKKPCVSELTGISEARLECFATHLRAYLVAISVGSSEGILIVPSISRHIEQVHAHAADSPSSARSSHGMETKSRSPSLSLTSKKNGHDDVPEIGSFHTSKAAAGEISPILSSGSHASVFSPYYCWCPPRSSTIQSVPCGVVPLPPLTSLFPSTALLSQLPPLDLPHISVSTSPISPQIPLFTPLMCDPIVHIPVIEVCSSGQGYLVNSTTPVLSTSIVAAPLHPKILSPLISETDSLEKSALETLRQLINGNNQIASHHPSASENQVGGIPGMMMMAMGSRGFYHGMQDVLAQAGGTMELHPPERGSADTSSAGTSGSDCEADGISLPQDLDGTK